MAAFLFFGTFFCSVGFLLAVIDVREDRNEPPKVIWMHSLFAKCGNENVLFLFKNHIIQNKDR